VAEHPRIEDLRRRVLKDPASIAFAQLAEELRRAGSFDEAIAVCRAGLAVHPGYLSARVTLGRALIEQNQLDEAQHELETVRRNAVENLAALRGLADIHHRRGHLADALTHYEAALAIARNDPDLEETVAALRRQLSKAQGAAPRSDGMSFEQAHAELMNLEPPPLPPPVVAAVPPAADPPAADESNRAVRTIEALEHWLDAVDAARTNRRS
jgi:tetratricopeptide (TPR) repeat protein